MWTFTLVWVRLRVVFGWTPKAYQLVGSGFVWGCQGFRHGVGGPAASHPHCVGVCWLQRRKCSLGGPLHWLHLPSQCIDVSISIYYLIVLKQVDGWRFTSNLDLNSQLEHCTVIHLQVLISHDTLPTPDSHRTLYCMPCMHCFNHSCQIGYAHNWSSLECDHIYCSYSYNFIMGYSSLSL